MEKNTGEEKKTYCNLKTHKEGGGAKAPPKYLEKCSGQHNLESIRYKRSRG